MTKNNKLIQRQMLNKIDSLEKEVVALQTEMRIDAKRKKDVREDFKIVLWVLGIVIISFLLAIAIQTIQ